MTPGEIKIINELLGRELTEAELKQAKEYDLIEEKNRIMRKVKDLLKDDEVGLLKSVFILGSFGPYVPIEIFSKEELVMVISCVMSKRYGIELTR